MRTRDELDALLKRADDTRREAEDVIERVRRSLQRRPSYPDRHAFGLPGDPPDNDQTA